jgi:hypothetical protein
VLILTAGTTGIRQSELLGVRWRDVDVAAQRIRVRNAWVRGEHSGEGKSELSTSRSVPMTDRLALEPACTAAVERATGRRVNAFLTKTRLSPHVTLLVFILGRPRPPPGSTEGNTETGEPGSSPSAKDRQARSAMG